MTTVKTAISRLNDRSLIASYRSALDLKTAVFAKPCAFDMSL
jgi:hypothetical protein